MPQVARRLLAAVATVVALWPLLIGTLLILYFTLTLFSVHVDPPAVRKARGCCPRPLTFDAAVAFPAAAAGVLIVVAVLPILMWLGARFAMTGATVPARVVLRRVVRVAVPAALIGVAVATAGMIRLYGLLS